MRLDPRWRTLYVTRFVLEFVIAPVLPVVTALDDDFETGGSHDREQSIAVHNVKGLKQIDKLQKRFGSYGTGRESLKFERTADSEDHGRNYEAHKIPGGRLQP